MAERTPEQQKRYEKGKRWMAIPGNREKMREAYKRYYRKNTAKVKAKVRRQLLRRRGITPDDYDAILRLVGGCAICDAKTPGWDRKYFHIDHDHKTGEFRGLLCQNCNLGLGQFKDNPEVLRRAVEYLEGRPCNREEYGYEQAG